MSNNYDEELEENLDSWGEEDYEENLDSWGDDEDEEGWEDEEVTEEYVEDDAEEYARDDGEEYAEDDVQDDADSYAQEEDEVKENTRPDDAIASILNIDKGSFTISVGTVDIEDLVFPNFIKDSRKETYSGLARIVEELGVLSPIHIAITEGFDDYIKETGSEEGYEGPKYIVLDGLRRVFALQKNRLTRINAVIYDFKDKSKLSDMQNILSLILNKSQSKNWGEIWYMYQILEEQSILSPGNIEYLLQLEPGDAMKLKEIMVRKSEFPEPANELLGKKKNLQQAYNMLIKALKEQDQLAREDITGISKLDQTEGIVDDSTNEKLSDDEVKEILDMSSSFEGDLTDDEFNDMVGADIPEDRFETHGDRHLDPALRAAVLGRDNYTCQVSGLGVESGWPTKYALAVLQVHHKIPVADGGTNEMNNLITLSQDPHTLIHVIQRNGGKLPMKKPEFDALPDERKEYIQKVMNLARIAVEADKRLGKTKDQIKADTSENMKYQMPGVLQQQNMEAIASGAKK